MEALLSLEPALELLGTLARDLQGDYLPLLPRVLGALADLVDAGGWRLGRGWAERGFDLSRRGGGWRAAAARSKGAARALLSAV